MKIITSISEMRSFSHEAKNLKKTIGLVPTMGYLHEGHFSLVRASREECEIVVLSSFVNPLQFGPSEDFREYPRDRERDIRLSENGKVDVFFEPRSDEMYPADFSAWVEVTGHVTSTMCGHSRPGHFKGVTTVVMKLFNIVMPDRSYFGQKDAQQAAVIKKMVKDLNSPISIRVMPTVRESDGLAMSSRNKYLNESERAKAKDIFRSLRSAEALVSNGETSSEKIKSSVRKILLEGEGMEIDYIEIADAETLEPRFTVIDNTIIALAVKVGKTRLIDNIVITGAGKRGER